MTEEERRHGREEYAGKSASQLARELLRLLLVLIWKFILWLIKKFLKGVLWCIEATEKGCKRLNTWWHANDTQEKVAKIKAWLRKAIKTSIHWSIIAGKATLKGLAIALLILDAIGGLHFELGFSREQQVVRIDTFVVSPLGTID